MSRKREQAILALLSRATVKAAAAEAGIAEKTLRTWMKDPDFAGAWRRARRQLVEVSIGHIQAGLGLAVDVLLVVAKDAPKPADRVRAAVALLDNAFRGVELTDFAAEVEALKQQIQELRDARSNPSPPSIAPAGGGAEPDADGRRSAGPLAG